jgi:hypothetical protein
MMLYIGDRLESSTMIFRSLRTCNWYASEVVKRYGNYRGYDRVPVDKRATAYCVPREVDPNTTRIYDH